MLFLLLLFSHIDIQSSRNAHISEESKSINNKVGVNTPATMHKTGQTDSARSF